MFCQFHWVLLIFILPGTSKRELVGCLASMLYCFMTWQIRFHYKFQIRFYYNSYLSWMNVNIQNVLILLGHLNFPNFCKLRNALHLEVLCLIPVRARWCQEGMRPQMLLCHTTIQVCRPVLILETKNQISPRFLP